MLFLRLAIFIAAVGLGLGVACQSVPASINSQPPTPPTSASTEATEPAPAQAAAPTETRPAPSGAPAVVAAPEPTHTAVPTAANTPQPNSVPRPAAVVALSPQPTPTVAPTPAAESCTSTHSSTYTGPVISGPSEPDLPQDNDSVFRSLTVHPADPDIVALGTERNGFLWSDDGGETWTRYRQGLRPQAWGYPEVWDMDFAPSDPSVVMAATLGSPGPPSGAQVAEGLYKSTDGGQTWTLLNCGFSTSRSVSVRFDPSNPNIAVVGLEGGFPSYTGANRYFEGGIFRTEDGGENWEKVAVAPDDGRNGYWHLRVVETEPPQIITFGMNYNDLSENLGFMRGSGMGSEWEPFAPEFRNRFIDNFDVSADGRSIYVSERDDYSGWYSKDGGETWSESPGLQANGPLAVSPADADLVVFASFSDIRRSTDGFKSAQIVMRTPKPVRDIVFSPSHPNIVYAETDGYVLYRSDDGGRTWRQMVSGREDVLSVQP